MEDECGVCNGSGIPSGQCDCNGNVRRYRVCGGSYTADADLDNICDDVDSCLLGCKELRPTGETIGNERSENKHGRHNDFDQPTPIPPLIESMPKIVFAPNEHGCLTTFNTSFSDVFEEHIKESMLTMS